MVIKLYSTSSDSSDVNKSLTLLGERECEIKGTNNIFSPVIIVKDIGAANYCQIMGSPYNGRYYFIRPQNPAAHGVVTLNLQDDVLMSLKSQFLNETGIILRQENSANLYLADNQFPVEAKKETFFKEFSSGFETGFKYYLTIGG